MARRALRLRLRLARQEEGGLGTTEAVGVASTTGAAEEDATVATDDAATGAMDDSATDTMDVSTVVGTAAVAEVAEGSATGAADVGSGTGTSTDEMGSPLAESSRGVQSPSLGCPFRTLTVLSSHALGHLRMVSRGGGYFEEGELTAGGPGGV